MYPIGTIVEHKTKSEFGYGIIVFNFPELAGEELQKLDLDEFVAVVLWHGDEEKDLTEAPQVHPYSELKILNTIVGFA